MTDVPCGKIKGITHNQQKGLYLEKANATACWHLGIKIRHNRFDSGYPEEIGGLDFENEDLEGEAKNFNGRYTISDKTFEREYLRRFTGNKFAILIVSFLVLTRGQLERLKQKCKKGLHIIELGFQVNAENIGRAKYWLTRKLYHIKKLLFNSNKPMSQKSISHNPLVSVYSKIINSEMVNSNKFIDVNNKNSGRRSILKNAGVDLVCIDEKETLNMSPFGFIRLILCYPTN